MLHLLEISGAITDVFYHPHTGKKYQLRGTITCNTTYVIYMLKCPCGLCYIGKTNTELKTRVSEHKSATRNNDQKLSIARHFNMCKHEVSALRFMGVEVLKAPPRGRDGDTLILQKESGWIFELDTLLPKGFNEELGLECFFMKRGRL